jgi:hypothetical protein
MSALPLPNDPFDLAAWLERVMAARPGAEREAQALLLLQALEAPPTLDGLTVPGAFPQEGGGHLH